MTIYFQSRLNDVHIASGFCERLEWLDDTCTEVRFWTGSNFINITGIGLEVKYRFEHECIVEDGHILAVGEKVG